MTVEEIKLELHKKSVIHQAAMKMREILDAAKADYGDTWDDDDAEEEIISLAT